MFCCFKSTTAPAEPMAKEEAQVEAREAEEKEEAVGLKITFAEEQPFNLPREVELIFAMRPLGMTFDAILTFTGEAPVVIAEVAEGGHAAALGVKVGMVIKAIGADDVTSLPFRDCLAKLAKAAEALPTA
mmetsp:Transcript_123836/g.309538  ORF Transcript_123836/g.309538 Transcript_123836/m.309538 type:complete len:130 (+) Transcript_123836:101-490(+)